MELLKGKTALITGGSHGIGFAIAQAFAQQGANLILIARDENKLIHREEKLKKFGIDILSISKDISEKDASSHIYTLVQDKCMRVDILVNNAGVARFIPFSDSDESILDYHLNLNIRAPYLLTKAFLKDLTETRGNVINISSYFARRMLQDRPSTAYSLTKGGIESFTKALAYELGPVSIRVNAIAPGTIRTPQVETNFNKLNPHAKDRFKQMIQTIYPMQTIGNPEDIANMALFLATDQAKWITGGIFPVDGGLTTN